MFVVSVTVCLFWLRGTFVFSGRNQTFKNEQRKDINANIRMYRNDHLKCTKSHYNKFSTEEFIMIYTPKITSDIQINSLRDLVKTNPFFGGQYIEN